jgi:hypothetical protein
LGLPTRSIGIRCCTAQKRNPAAAVDFCDFHTVPDVAGLPLSGTEWFHSDLPRHAKGTDQAAAFAACGAVRAAGQGPAAHQRACAPASGRSEGGSTHARPGAARCGPAAVVDARQNVSALDRNDFSSNRHPDLVSCLSMIFSENRFPLFGIML